MIRRLLFGTFLLAMTAVAAAGVVAGYYVAKWDAVVSERFRGYQWSFPSKIFSDGALIYPGIDLEAVGLVSRLKELGYQEGQGGQVTRKGEYVLNATDNYLDVYFRDSPLPSEDGAGKPVRFSLDQGIAVRIEDLRSKEELQAVDLEPALLSGLYKDVWEERRVVTLHEVSPLLLQAIIAVEDQRFYEHHGVDPVGLIRAVVVNVRSGTVRQGGSTLTQQLMKNMFLSSARIWERKVRETLMALIVEYRFSKSEILERYINEIYLGQKGAQEIHGVSEASEFYFSKLPHELSVDEIAMLAGLISGPNKFSPFRNPDLAARRRTSALISMLKQNVITPAQFETAVQAPLRTVPPRSRSLRAPYYVDFVRKELSDDYPAEVLTSEGLTIHTALDLHLQHLAEQTVRAGVEKLEKKYPRLKSDKAENRLQVCLIAIQPQTGAIKAMMGGRDYGSTQFNRCTQARRQPGSVFKPFTYLAALERGRDNSNPVLPTTRIEDSPFPWAYDRQIWTPANYKKKYLGTVTVRQALEHSLNAATTRLAHDVGLSAIVDVARRLGIESPLPLFPSIVLGSAEVTPYEVARAFSVLANSGLRARPISIVEVFDRQGIPIERNPLEVEQIIAPETAYLLNHLMEGVLDRGTGRRARSMGFDLPAAGKTGTTNDYRDAWFVGFTPNLLTVVWIGFDHRTDLNLSGSEAALPIWTEFMKPATAGMPPTPFLPPPGAVLVRIDPASGQLATPDCPRSMDEAFYEGQQPTSPCPLHSWGDYSMPSAYPAEEATY
jgi:penicillin-binding protein 1B